MQVLWIKNNRMLFIQIRASVLKLVVKCAEKGKGC